MNSQKLKKQLEKAEIEFKQHLFDTIAAPNVAAAPLRTEEENTQESRLQINKSLQQFQEDIDRGFQCFKNHVLPADQERFSQLCDKLMSLKGEVTESEIEFLETIASKELMRENNDDASCMFRFIIQIASSYSPGWVGWALAEKALGNQAESETIFEVGMKFLPDDYFIRIYAAECYMATGRKERAKEILQSALEKLIQVNGQNTKTYQLIKKLEQRI